MAQKVPIVCIEVSTKRRSFETTQSNRAENYKKDKISWDPFAIDLINIHANDAVILDWQNYRSCFYREPWLEFLHIFSGFAAVKF